MLQAKLQSVELFTSISVIRRLSISRSLSRIIKPQIPLHVTIAQIPWLSHSENPAMRVFWAKYKHELGNTMDQQCIA